MQRAALTTAALFVSSCIAIAQQRPTVGDVPSAADRQTSVATITLAMGPISAPQRRNPNEATGSSSQSTPASDLTPHKKARQRHRHSSPN